MAEQSRSQRIVVPVDLSSDSEQALPYARAIAGPGDTIVLLNAIPIPEIELTLLPKPVDMRTIQRHLHDASATYLQGVIDRLKMPGEIPVSPMVVDGAPASEIISHTSSLETSMIVMTTVGRGAAGRLALGSVADHVARTASVPVLLVRVQEVDVDLEAPAHIGRIVVPIDGSGRSLRAIPTAVMLATRLTVPIMLLRVRELDRMAAIYSASLTPKTYDDLVDREDKEIQAMLEQTAADIERQGISASWKILSGATAQVIEQEANDDDIIVMASHGRGGMRRWLFGSVAERLIRTGPVPVVLVPSI